MTPLFGGALCAVLGGRRSALVWSLVLTCLVVYAGNEVTAPQPPG